MKFKLTILSSTVISLILTQGLTAHAKEAYTLDEIVVTGKTNDSNNTQKINIFGQQFNKNLYPQQINSISSQDFKRKQAKTLFDVVQADSSVNSNYAPIGYQENYSIRGSTLNLDSSYMLNGAPITNRQIPNLANKQRIDIVKGISGANGLQNVTINGGGAINYITKRPANVQQITIDAKTKAEYGIEADLGSKSDSGGYRINLDYHKLKPYVDTATGEKYLASVALDINRDKLKWQIDADYQEHKQYSVPGVQLLGGTNIPDVSNKLMLNNPNWRKQVNTAALNLGNRLEYAFTPDSKISSNMQYSKTKIDDYVAFPYSFKSNGDYKLADYQAPDQTLTNKYIDLTFNTAFNTGELKHRATIGVSHFNFSKKNPTSITYAKEVRNIYNPEQIIQAYTLTGETIGSSYTSLKHQQNNIFVRDVIEYDKAQLFLGATFANVKESANNINANIANVSINKFLPNIALVYGINDNFGVYTSYAKNLEIGRDADVIGYNSGYLPPKIAQQFELGFNYGNKLHKIQAAYFKNSKPFEYVDPSAYTYVQDGKELRSGLELNLSGKNLDTLTNYGLSATYFLQATQKNTAINNYNNSKAVNVPKVKTSVWLEQAIPNIQGLYAGLAWNYEASKSVLYDASVKIPSYNTFDANLRYNQNYGKNNYTFRLGIDNILDKKYFKDAGIAYGEHYIHYGAPRTYKLSMSVDL